MYDQQQRKWSEAYYGQLVGTTITGVETAVEDGEVWVTLNCVDSSGEQFTLEISRDSEGNGPGFLFGLPTVSV